MKLMVHIFSSTDATGLKLYEKLLPYNHIATSYYNLMIIVIIKLLENMFLKMVNNGYLFLWFNCTVWQKKKHIDVCTIYLVMHVVDL